MKKLLFLTLCVLPLSAMQKSKYESLQEYSRAAAIGGTFGGSLIMSVAAAPLAVYLPVIAGGALAGVGAKYIYDVGMEHLLTPKKQELVDQTKGK